MGQDPVAIRQEIERTRTRMGETVGALAYRADVPARTRDSFQDRIGEMKARLTGATSRVTEATPDRDDMVHAGNRAVGIAQENPLGLALGAVATGFLAGLLIPASRIEDERLGPIADELREQVRETGQEALERGSQLVQDVAQIAADRAQEAAADVMDSAQGVAQDQTEELKVSAQRSAEQVRQSARR